MIRKRITELFAFAIVLLNLVTTSVSAAIIDFEALKVDGASITSLGLSYSEDGFTVSQDQALYDLKSINDGSGFYNGSVTVYNSRHTANTILTVTGGGTFDLNSIDLDGLGTVASQDVTFVTNDGFSQTFTLDASRGLETFDFDSNFLGVSIVAWHQALPFHHFDNIVVNESVVPSVPEPSTYAMMALGLLGIAGMSRRKNQA